MRYPASPGGRRAVDRWLTAQEGGEPLVGSVAHVPVLTHESFVHGVEEVRELWGSGAWVSWWAGPAADSGAAWPVARDGAPLRHVVAVHLAELDATIHRGEREAWGSAVQAGLPAHGVLELFVDDRELELRDTPLPCAVLRWTQGPSTALLDPPAAAGPPAALCGLWLSGFVVPSPADVTEPEAARRAASVWQTFERTWGSATAGSAATSRGDGVEGAARRASYAYGHSRQGRRPVEHVLVRALGPDHGIRLVLSLVPPVTGLLPPGCSLEVWLRDVDVVGGRTDRAVCLLRDLGP